MKFQARTEQELQQMNLIPEGIYDFEVIEAKDTTSKSGNEMIELKLKIWDKEGRERILRDWLVSTDAAAFKLYLFAKCVGLKEKYELGEIEASDCIKKCGKLDLGIQKDKSGQYADRNAVAKYVCEKEKNAKSPNGEPNHPAFDDDVPF